MTVHSLYIVNKAGGLIYQKDFSAAAPKLELNDHLRLGSTFHGLHAITSSLSPCGPSSGIKVLETDTLILECFQTPTGIKFFATAPKGTTNLAEKLKGVYDRYADFVLKNPFYELEQPIRCELFDQALSAWLVERSAPPVRLSPMRTAPGAVPWTLGPQDAEHGAMLCVSWHGRTGCSPTPRNALQM
eukprot:CAMPEP_0177636240 /NCGR_PEP_ID=MMETSP0447-20121125/4331_1 /TAXON_ID=0 /ORGANISM="Stygamoeba regulata, Strain BSH-02190019" /LENGTH=186 /DNA_ID=CAMNT_0019138085 /DNA_START=16 /DNA_END=577 /DNA_ORIENTATION=+